MTTRSTPPMLRALAAALLLALAGSASCADAPRTVQTVALPALPALDALPHPTLPQSSAVAQVLAETPGLREAQAMQQAAAHSSAALRAGSNEVNVQAQVQRRRIDSAADAGRYTEWQLLANRTLRLPEQAQADGRLADALQASAQAALQAARQRAIGDMLTAWFAAQRAHAEAALAQQDLELIDAQLRALQRREALGDASRLERELMQAEQSRARATLLLAQGAAESSRAALRARYPQLADAQPQTADAGDLLRLPAETAEQLRSQALQTSALLAEQRAAVQKAQAQAAQARAARTPQPTLGAYVGSERGGSERIVGLQLAVPLGGVARVEQERAALAEADAAQWRLRELQAQTEAEFARLYALAQAQLAAVQAAEQAAAAQAQASNRTQRAWQLGEAALAEWLLARRSAIDAARQVLQARFDAAVSIAQLRLIAGMLDPKTQ